MNSRIIIFLILCFLFEIPILRAQDTDVPGSHDHSLLPRLPGFYIRDFEENRYDFENFKVNDGESRVEGHKYVIDYYLQSNKTPQGKAYILQRYSNILEAKGAKVMFKGPYYSVFKFSGADFETWVRVDPGNYDGKRYFLTIVEKQVMKQEVGLNSNTGLSSNEKDVAGSKDYPMISRMPDFYIGGYEETKQASETFATTSGDIETNGHKFYIDYYLEDGKIPPGKIQILENYKTALLNAKAEILLDGAYYDVYKVRNNGGETWIKIDPGNYDGKRYEITVVESTETSPDSGDLSMVPDSGRIKFQSLKVTEAGGKLLLRANSADIEAPKKFFFKKPQEVSIHTQIKNDSETTWENGMVEFRVDGEVTGTYVISSLGPGEVYEIGSSYDAQEVKDHDIEVNLYDQDSPHALASINGQLLSENDTAEVTGFVYPDLEIRDIVYQTNPERIEVEIQNNGAPLSQTSLLLKSWISNPYRSWTGTYETSVDVELGPGERKWYSLIGHFSWPNIIDNPSLNFTALVDANREITEIDEGNNSLFKQVCIPCDVHIDHISNPWVYKFKFENLQDYENLVFNTIYLYGKFGNQRASKKVVFKEKSGTLFYFPQLNENLWDPLIWDDFSLEVNVSSLPVGEYKVFVNCSSSTNDLPIPFSSNAIDFKVRKRPNKPYNFGKWVRIALLDPFDPTHYQILKNIIIKDGTLDARKLANALYEEFGQNLSLPSNEIIIWTQQDNSDIILHSDIEGEYFLFEKILFEVWHIEPYYRLNFSEIPFTFELNSLQHTVKNLDPGIYEFKARFIYTGGKEISKSIIFRVNIF